MIQILFVGEPRELERQAGYSTSKRLSCQLPWRKKSATVVRAPLVVGVTEPFTQQPSDPSGSSSPHVNKLTSGQSG
jgi:hypothetical protein